MPWLCSSLIATRKNQQAFQILIKFQMSKYDTKSVRKFGPNENEKSCNLNVILHIYGSSFKKKLFISQLEILNCSIDLNLKTILIYHPTHNLTLTFNKLRL